MARKKVKLVYIPNDSSRRSTFKKRKRGLLKKVSELSTLCGVNACAIVYGQYDRYPEIWPTPTDAHRVLMKFKSLPEMEQSKKMMNQEVFIWNRITKARETVKKLERDNRYKEITHLMFQTMTGKSLSDLNADDLSDLAWMINEKSKEIGDRMKDISKQMQIVPVANPNRNPNVTVVINGGGGGGGSVGPRHHPPAAVQNANIIAATNHNAGIINIMGGEQRHQPEPEPEPEPELEPQQQVVAICGGTNVMNAGGGNQQVVNQQPPVDPMLAAMNNLQRQSWFVDTIMNPKPNPNRDAIVSGGYDLAAIVGDDHLLQVQRQMQILGMSSTSASFGGGVAGNNNNINANASAASVVASGWMANNPFFP